MVDIDQLEPGSQQTYERTFTRADIEQFAELSRDEGYHHPVADSDGTVLVHGRLTATLPMKLGGEVVFLSGRLTFQFPRPVFTGQPVTCELTVDRLEERDDRYELDASFECRSLDGEVVLEGETDGGVLQDRVEQASLAPFTVAQPSVTVDP